jgi:YbbR domain-containing protein
MTKPKIFENLWVKLASLVLATLLWFHVATNKVYQQEVTLPLVQVDLTGRLLLTEPPPESVTVIVSATGKKLLQTDWKKGGLKLVVNRSQPGRFRTELNPSNFSFARGDKVDLTEIINPREFEFDCDKKLEKKLPVRSRVVAVADDGFAVGAPDSIAPEVVTITGPAGLLKDLAYVDTRNEILKGARNDLTMKVPVEKPKIFGVQITPDSVTVTVKLIAIKSRMFSDIPIRVKNVPPGSIIEIFPSKIGVRAGGSQKSIDSLTGIRISALADFNQANDKGMAPVDIILPPGITLLSKSVDSVRIIRQ